MFKLFPQMIKYTFKITWQNHKICNFVAYCEFSLLIQATARFKKKIILFPKKTHFNFIH